MSTTTARICDEEMGLESGDMPNTFLSASSYSPGSPPTDARLNGLGAWKPSTDDDDPYFEVVLHAMLYS